jgi:Zn finger protein HypA/HybF involved in hydrogenase expression
MHEAGLANSVVDAVRGAGPLEPGARVRLLVSGGHHEPSEFESALRLHLRGNAPDLEPLIDIVHVEAERLCMGCGGTFASIRAEDPCPACGGTAMPLPVPERIDVEVLRPVRPAG